MTLATANRVSTIALLVLGTMSSELAGARSAGAPQATTVQFELNSTGSTYPFVARLTGTLVERRDSLVIHVVEGLVRSQIPSDLVNDGVGREVSIAFGLGRQDPDGWNFEHETEPQLVVALLPPGGTESIGTLDFVIAGLDTVPLADRWLVAEVRVQQRLPGIEAGLLTSYVCADANLRGPTPASRVRAEGMKTKYSQIC